MEPVILISVFLGAIMILLGLVGWIMDASRPKPLPTTYVDVAFYEEPETPLYDWKEECPNDFR